MLTSIAGYSLLIFMLNTHAFHVSVCEIYHNQDTQALEITMKIFLDDLELAVQQSGVESFNLMDVDEEAVDSESLKNYLLSRFEISTNSKVRQLDFVGFEYDDDALLCYLEGKKVKKFNQIVIRNEVITEIYEDQINLTHLQSGESLKSIKTSPMHPSGTIC